MTGTATDERCECRHTREMHLDGLCTACVPHTATGPFARFTREEANLVPEWVMAGCWDRARHEYREAEA